MAEGLRAREHHVRVMPYVGGEGAARRAILAGARTGERRDEE